MTPFLLCSREDPFYGNGSMISLVRRGRSLLLSPSGRASWLSDDLRGCHSLDDLRSTAAYRFSVPCRTRKMASYSSSSSTKDKVKESVDASSVAYWDATGDYRKEAWMEDPSLPLYRRQADLPRLPVPELNDTLDRFLPTALPLVESSAEGEALLRACAHFPKQAQELQERLRHRAQSLPESSWLQEWWNTLGYLQPRCSNAMHVSYFFHLQPLPAMSGLERAALVLHHLLPYAHPWRTGTAETQYLTKDLPLCASQYKYLWNACRIPRDSQSDSTPQDVYRLYYDRQSTASLSFLSHVIVAYRGHFYKLDLVSNDEDGGNPQVHSVGSLRRSLEEIVAMEESSDGNDNLPLLGWLTSTNRDDWAKAYRILESSSSSAIQKDLELLQSALCVLCIDDEADNATGEKLEETASRLWHGDSTNSPNRWYDKSIQIVVSRRHGRLGLIGEHSMADGMPAVDVGNFLMKTAVQSPDTVPQNGLNHSSAAYSRLFDDSWRSLSSDERGQLQSYVTLAKDHLTERIQDHELYVQHYQAFGSRRIKSAGFSPDALVQGCDAAGGLSYLCQPVATYEAAQTRKYLHGRTETARPVSPAMNAWVECMSHPAALVGEKHELLQQATEAHVGYIRQALDGFGVDRHFFGLSMLVENGEKVPDLLQDPVFLRSKRWRLSTSTLPNTTPGFGNVEEDGIGVGYDVRSTELFFTITGRGELGLAKAFHRELGCALDEIATLFDSIEKDDLPQRPRSKL